MSGWLFGLFLLLTFSARFLIEFLKEDQEPFEKTLPLNMGQLLSLPFIFSGLYFLLRGDSRNKNVKVAEADSYE